MGTRHTRTAAAEYNHWYDLAPWRRARKLQLLHQPKCERHLARGKLVFATIVNHRIPHRGNRDLFLDPDNLESVCKDCHDGVIQKEEKRGHAIGTSADGRPVDKNHPWNQR